MRALALVALLLAAALPAHAQEAGYTSDDTFAAIDQASAATGISAAWLRRVVGCETGQTFDPYAVGDHGTSYGAVQLHRGGGELPRFYAQGYGDPFDPYEAVTFLATEIAAGRAGAWSCR